MKQKQLLKELELKLNNDPMNDELMSKIASIMIETHDLEGALITLRNAVIKKPNIQILTNMGYFLMYEGEPFSGRWFRQEEKAIKYLEDSLSYSPRTHHTYSLLGEAYLRVRKYSMAEAVLKTAIAITSTFANQNNMGVALFYQDKYDQASEHFHNSFMLRNEQYKSWHSYESYGFCLAKLNMMKEAALVGECLIQQASNDYDIYLNNIAKIFYQIDDLERCINSFSIAIAHKYLLGPEEIGIYLYSLYKSNKAKEADEVYYEAINDREERINDLKKSEESNWNYLNCLQEEVHMIRDQHKNVIAGKKPTFEYIPYIEKDCYFYGCIRHNTPYSS